MEFRSVLATSVVLVLALLPIASSAQLAAGDKHLHPQNRLDARRGTAIPCDAFRATVELAPFFNETYVDATEGAGVVPSYGCEGWDEGGPEHVYELVATEDIIVDIWLADNEPDHDLILLNACDSDSCIVQANTQISAVLEANEQYILVVDGYVDAAGEYELTFDARGFGLPDIVCTEGTYEDLGGFIAAGVSDAITDTTLFERPNYVSVADCNDGLSATRGGERWYKVVLAGSDDTYDDGTDIGSLRLDLTVTPTDPALDLAIWLWSGCGSDAVCLAFIDEGSGGSAEEVRYLNDLPEPLTMYMAVDCIVPPTDGPSSSFTLETEITVPTEQRSLSQMRNLFR